MGETAREVVLSLMMGDGWRRGIYGETMGILLQNNGSRYSKRMFHDYF